MKLRNVETSSPSAFSSCKSRHIKNEIKNIHGIFSLIVLHRKIHKLISETSTRQKRFLFPDKPLFFVLT